MMAMVYYKKEIICKTEEETKLLAEKLAAIAQRGDIFALYGTLGAGKSTFSRYFIKYLSHATDVPSPTFTLLQTYDALNFEIYHYDFYRLKKPEEAYELEIEYSFFSAVCLIEWPQKIIPLLPRDVWKITITTNNNYRIFSMELSSKEKINRLEESLND